MPQLKRTESLIFELPVEENQLPLNNNLNTVLPALAYLSSSLPTNDPIQSASRWISLPPPPPTSILPKSYSYSSLLGPSPRKLYRRTYPHSFPKPNLYRKALIACAKKAARGFGGRSTSGCYN